MPKDARPRNARRTKLESLEDRVVMSADPLGGLLGGAVSPHTTDQVQVGAGASAGSESTAPPLVQHGDFANPVDGQEPDFWRNLADEQAYLNGLREVQQNLASAHNSSGLSAARERYGLRGSGQTVAVIDSGIAYDHYALGSGLGEGYRVVGGFDFTENDADPYDDESPTGAHGTHVAGIVGADGSETGVAPDVDLVGLRVFDDNGAGFFSWVEQALQWVHDNQDTFENPITTVNLSLGVNYNSDTLPGWANLENEFAQLVEDGIFISVSAGNDFASFGEPGLSYPAVSPNVVPVIAGTDSGSIASFSQRLPRGIVAPGTAIRSTVPDYDNFADGNGIADDYGFKSGTSMAAPYVAGAAVLVREAMEFAGLTDITQEDIYDHLIATADTIFDATTGLNYNQLNIEAALDALLPTDDYGSSVVDAFNLGTIVPDSSPAAVSAQSSISGLIGQVSDNDYFTFTAGATGTVTFSATNQSHYLDASFEGFGGEGWSDADGSYTFNVIAGQEYTVGLSSLEGIGYYDLNISAEATFTFTDWGAVAGQTTTTGVGFGSETWYRVQAGQSGLLTADLLNAAGQTGLQLYDASLNLIDYGADGRLDTTATAGEEFYLRLEGDGTADLRLTNLVSVTGDTVDVAGTAGDDTLTFTAGNTTHTVSVNGVEYSFDAASHTTFNLDGGAGNDSATLTGTSGDETAVLGDGVATLAGDGFTTGVVSTESIAVHAGGGNDVATINDTVGNDLVTLSPEQATANLSTGANLEATGFERIRAYSTGGADRAVFHDSVGDDTYVGRSDRALIYGNGYRNDAFGFARTFAYSTAGTDRAIFHDSAGDDTYVGHSDRALIFGDGYRNDAFGFARTFAYSTAGTDRAVFRDSAGDDTYVGYSDRALIYGDGYRNDAFGFARTFAYSTAGADRAVFHDSAGDDTYVGHSDRALIYGDGYRNDAFGFARTFAYSTAGTDRAIFRDSAGDDTYVARSDRALIYGDGYRNDAFGFARTVAYSTGGADLAVFISSDQADFLAAQAWGAYAAGDDYRTEAHNFGHIIARGDADPNDTSQIEAVDYLFEVEGEWG